MKLHLILLTLCLCGCASSGKAVLPDRPDCDARFLYVTSDAYVWIEHNQEKVVDADEAVAHLIRLHRAPQTEGDGCATSIDAPILWATFEATPAETDLVKERAQHIWQSLTDQGVELAEPRHVFRYATGRKPPEVYRAQGELGENAAAVRAKFDFATHILVRAELPGQRWEELCEEKEALDSYMTMSEAELAEKQRQSEAEAAAEQSRRDGPVTRVIHGTVHYSADGLMEILVPAIPPRAADRADCKLVNVREPGLLAVPRTRLDWLTEYPLF